MSSKDKRILNQTKNFIGQFINMQDMLKAKQDMEERIKELDNSIHEIEHVQDDIIQKLLKKNCYLSAEQMPLFDGTEIVVFIVTYDNNYMMYFDGILAEAKCHPEDEYDPQIGYAICRHRLMSQIMKLKYGV